MAACNSDVQMVKVMITNLSQGLFSSLAAERDNNGTKASETTTSGEMKEIIDTAGISTFGSFGADTPPTALIFYSNINRAEAEKEVKTLCRFFTKCQINLHESIFPNPSLALFQKEIEAAAEKTEHSGLIVAVMCHGSAWHLDFDDGSVRIDDVIRYMSSQSLACKPKVHVKVIRVFTSTVKSSFIFTRFIYIFSS